MKRRSLGLLFIGAVIVPSILLTFFAVRAVSHERAYIEQQLETALAAEAEAAVGRLGAELEEVREELSAGLDLPGSADPGPALERWRAEAPLAEVAFLLSPSFEILWPGAAGQAFLRTYGTFLSDRAVVPVYQNVARVLTEERRAAPEEGLAAGAAAPAAQSAAPEPRLDAGKQQALDLKVQSALEQDPELRASAYREAEQKGLKAEKRTVQPLSGMGPAGPAEPEPKSVFVSAPRRLSDIVAQGEEGLIPRFVEERLRMLYWKRVEGGRIAGCLLRDEPLRERLLAVAPIPFGGSSGSGGPADRVLAVLDETGRPLQAPGGVERDWRRPFVSREVSELLPRWEVALYLADPQAVADRTRVTVLLLGVLIAILFTSVAGGGTLVLRSLAAEMSLAQKKTTFVANVSHELKTPLTSIRLYAEMLKEKPRLDPLKRRRYLEIVVSETERLTRLINNVLDFSRMGKREKRYAMAPVDTAEVCREVVESQRARLEHEGFALTLLVECGPVPVVADAEALKQVLVNLLANAEKYSPGDVGTTPAEPGDAPPGTARREIEVEAARDGSLARIDVRDRGIGVAPRDAERIFEAFYRVDGSLTARTRGSGLGLTIARAIARDHGGDVRHEPREGGGSIFRLLLPLGGT